MIFNSLQYAIFLPTVFIIYWIIPNKFRWILLLIASYYFYMSWNPKYVVLILGTTFISYIATIIIEKTESKKKRKILLIIATFVCLGVLFVFKYFNFAIESFCSIFLCFGIELHHTTLNLLLPVGISFYTFQTMSYVFDVYRGNIAAEHHFGYYATFISFFPQLMAGPIERASNILPQIKSNHKFNFEEGIDGIKWIIIGLFQKMVIADTLSEYVDKVYDNIERYYGIGIIYAIIFFTIQIYCDFSGYSNIAIGSAKLFNIHLMRNFNSPYFSTSIHDFWKRWHISLTTWFREYIYIPLGGNKCSKIKQNINIMITFLISGLWHGANITFVIWGGIHGLAQIVEYSFVWKGQTINRLLLFVKWIIVFTFINITWVFFRSPSLNVAVLMISHAFDGVRNVKGFLFNNPFNLSYARCIYITILIFLFGLMDYLFYNNKLNEMLNRNKVISYLFMICLMILVVFFSKKGIAMQFIYFQF